ncbi:hypothetical protein BDV96DRAFT_245400 [Lophiotrema nucula]|uniref:Uncharacterized protein n=1 Tax=Lophiotrema nucula TaxID=690887 RepID=A0A6A5YQB1_9PLEO|nr:hypothetical protein BDV96DRAFT_245400 [Lophiotrema nucula]
MMGTHNHDFFSIAGPEEEHSGRHRREKKKKKKKKRLLGLEGAPAHSAKTIPVALPHAPSSCPPVSPAHAFMDSISPVWQPCLPIAFTELHLEIASDASCLCHTQALVEATSLLPSCAHFAKIRREKEQCKLGRQSALDTEDLSSHFKGLWPIKLS